jgi:hypothetical protein
MKQQINEIRRMQQLAGILKEGRQSDEYYTSKEVIEQALRAENIKFEELPVFYDSTTPAGDNDEIEKTKSQLNNLQNNGTSIEKYARERYLLKREGEEVYIFEDTTIEKSTPAEKK